MPKTKQHPADRKNYINTRMNDYILGNYVDKDTYELKPGVNRVRFGDPKPGMPPAERRDRPVRYVHDRDTTSQRFKSRKV